MSRSLCSSAAGIGPLPSQVKVLVQLSLTSGMNDAGVPEDRSLSRPSYPAYRVDSASIAARSRLPLMTAVLAQHLIDGRPGRAGVGLHVDEQLEVAVPPGVLRAAVHLPARLERREVEA